ARDQLWVVHSFDPMRDLKPDDLRFQLLQHAKDPTVAIRALSNESSKADSPFEREVVKRLVDAGFRVKQQVSVGHVRIDMVVEGDGQRLAVECDGDRYRPLESLAEDAARQAILERLGWQFVRIRGSAFYLDPEGALKRVFDRLAELGIEPVKVVKEVVEASADSTLLQELEGLREKSGKAVITAPQDAVVGPVVPAASDTAADPSPKPARKSKGW